MYTEATHCPHASLTQTAESGSKCSLGAKNEINFLAENTFFVRRVSSSQYMNTDSSHSVTSLTLMRNLCANPKDAAAWETFLQTYGPRIDAWCRRWKLQEADVQDVTQNILLKLAKQFSNFEYNQALSFRNWLRTVTENALSDFVKAQNRKTVGVSAPEMLTTMEAQKDLFERLSESFDLELLAAARTRTEESVDPKHWRVFSLMADENISGADAARQEGISVANAFAIKSRVQKLIRHQIRILDESGHYENSGG